MDKLRSALKTRNILVADGALGTLLQKAGIPEGSCPEMIAMERPELLVEIAREYVAAGAEIVQTNTFGATPLKLAEYGLAEQTETINRTAASLLRQTISEPILISGSCGPTGKLLQPYGPADPEDVLRGYRRQISGLVEGGVDIICIETMMDLQEAILAVRAGKEFDRPIMATMTFTATPNGYYTMMGNGVSECVVALAREGVAALGANCGFGIEHMIPLAEEISAVSPVPVIIQSNAGTPEIQEGEIVFPESAEEYGSHVSALLAAGVRIVGGCCGTTPDYTARIRQAVDRFLLR